MDNILTNIPKKINANLSQVTINNKLTYGDINIKNLKLNNTNNYLNFNNVYADNINIKPIMIFGNFNIFQFNNYGKDFSFDVNYTNSNKDYKYTDVFYKLVKNLEKTMENYTTGLNIKCYQGLKLDDFSIDSTTIGENIIYFKDCNIEGDLNITLAGRCLVMIDNTNINGTLKFNLKTKFPLPKKNNNILFKSINRYKNDTDTYNKINIMVIVLVLIILTIGIYYIWKQNKDNILSNYIN